MPFWVFGLTNPISLFLIFTFLEIGIKIVTKVQHRLWRNSVRLRLIIYVILILLSIPFNYKMLFTDDNNESPVIASALFNLTREQIDHLEDSLELFNEYDFITECEIEDLEDDPDIYKTCDISWFRMEPQGLLSINITFFRNEKQAIEHMRYIIRLRMGKRYTHISRERNGNNFEVLLYDSYMERSHGVPVSYRILPSIIRINNITIDLYEHPRQHQLDKNLSNDFIALFCKILGG